MGSVPDVCHLSDVIAQELIQLTFTNPLNDLGFNIDAIFQEFLVVARW
jgi:hypothetical protein